MTKAVVDQFAEAGFELFLHGSRSKVQYPRNYDYSSSWFFMAKDPEARITFETDWDYAVQTSKSVIEYLEAQGFDKKEESSYRDSMTEFVYEKTLEDGSKIQISTRYDLGEFKDLWNSITNNFYYWYLWKRGPNKPSGDNIRGMLEDLRQMRRRLLKSNSLDPDLLWE